MRSWRSARRLTSDRQYQGTPNMHRKKMGKGWKHGVFFHGIFWSTQLWNGIVLLICHIPPKLMVGCPVFLDTPKWGDTMPFPHWSNIHWATNRWMVTNRLLHFPNRTPLGHHKLSLSTARKQWMTLGVWGVHYPLFFCPKVLQGWNTIRWARYIPGFSDSISL